MFPLTLLNAAVQYSLLLGIFSLRNEVDLRKERLLFAVQLVQQAISVFQSRAMTA